MNSKHGLIMLLCCLIPVVGIAAITVFNVPLNNALWFGMILLCPLSHLFLMKFMMGGHDSAHARDLHTPQEKIDE
jgi:hypothetical protein